MIITPSQFWLLSVSTTRTPLSLYVHILLQKLTSCSVVLNRGSLAAAHINKTTHRRSLFMFCTDRFQIHYHTNKFCQYGNQRLKLNVRWWDAKWILGLDCFVNSWQKIVKNWTLEGQVLFLLLLFFLLTLHIPAFKLAGMINMSSAVPVLCFFHNGVSVSNHKKYMHIIK